FTTLIIADLMKKYPSIPPRLEEEYHFNKDDIPLVSVYSTRNVTVRRVLILDAFLTEEIHATDDYKENKIEPESHKEHLKVVVDDDENEEEKMRRNMIRWSNDPALWDVLKRKFEKFSTYNTSCRDDAFHSKRHDDHQEDDAPPEGKKR
nr:hypothetical protein [Tanacetum cinerariifolium]